MTDPKTIWLEPRCEDCPKGMTGNGLRGRLWNVKPRKCPVCGRQPTEYVRKEE